MYSRVFSPLTASDGENLALFRWLHEDSAKESAWQTAKPRAVVILVHGLGEHAGRYDHVASILKSWNFEVHAYDQRGHGQSGGKAGVLPFDNALLNDLADVVDETRAQYPGMPLILLGHSLGGLVASRFVALHVRLVEALVLSSPALGISMGAFQKLMLAVLPRFLPDLTVGSGLDAQFLSHDDRVVQAYQADRRVHNRLSPRLGKFIAETGPKVIAAASQWRVPTLVLYAGDDKMVNASGSRQFVETAKKSRSVARGTVAGVCFDGLYHEIFNELQSTPVFMELRTWLDDKFKKNRALTP